MSKIIISGAAGFIGYHLSKHLLQLGHDVFAIDNLSYGIEHRMEELKSNTRFHFYKMDVCELDKQELPACDIFIHLASEKLPRYSSGWETLERNSKSFDAALAYCIRQDARLLFASTSDVYGLNPELPFTETSACVLGSSLNKRWAYAGSKLHNELRLAAAGREFGLRYEIMRFFGCYGPSMSPGWRSGPQQVFFEQAIAAKALEIHGDGTQTRTYIYIDDLIEGIVALLNHGSESSGIWNFCSSEAEEISVLDLAKAIWQIAQPGIEFEANFIPYSSFGNYEEVMRRVGSAAKANSHLKWRCKNTLVEGLQLTYESFKA